MKKKKIMTIDVTPTWSQIMPVLVRILEESGSKKAKEGVRNELFRLARLVDDLNARGKAGKK